MCWFIILKNIAMKTLDDLKTSATVVQFEIKLKKK